MGDRKKVCERERRESVCVCICVCVYEREKKRETEILLRSQQFSLQTCFNIKDNR